VVVGSLVGFWIETFISVLSPGDGSTRLARRLEVASWRLGWS
jgi:hypothetical protein